MDSRSQGNKKAKSAEFIFSKTCQETKMNFDVVVGHMCKSKEWHVVMYVVFHLFATQGR